MKTSREKVLEYIRTHSIASATDISRALKMTAANARHHIQILLSQGLLEASGERQQTGKGRPMQLYRLSQQAVGDNFHLLADAALVFLREQQGNDNYLRSLEKIASHLVTVGNKTDLPQPTKTMHLSQKLVSSIETLNRLNYQARWEAHRDGPRIFLGRCPYQKILEEHPELCQMDRSLLEMITSSSVTQIARLARDQTGATYCLFTINARSRTQQ